MGLKTIVKRLCKWLPSQWQLKTAVSLDEKAEAGVEQNIDFVDVAASSAPTDLDTSKSNAAIREQLSKAKPEPGEPAEPGEPPPGCCDTDSSDGAPVDVENNDADDSDAVLTKKAIEEKLSRCRHLYGQLKADARQEVLASFDVTPLKMRYIKDPDLLEKIGNELSDALIVQGDTA